MQQQTIYHLEKQINTFNEAPRTESKNFNATTCLTHSQIIALDVIAKQKGVSRSKLVGECVEFFLGHFDHLEKLDRYGDAVAGLLRGLP
jgi:hypothetical protein